MRRTHKIGPKSRTRPPLFQKAAAAADLGDEDTSSTEGFASPTEDQDQTDYGLDFTSSRLRGTPAAATRSRLGESLTIVTRNRPQNSPAAATRSRESTTMTPTRPRANVSVEQTQAAPTSRRKRRKPQHVRFFQEYKKLCQRTDFMIPRLPFSRVIREVLMAQSSRVTHITPTALEALQVSSEMYLTQRLQDSYMLSLHRGRVTLTVRDMQLMSYLRATGVGT